MLHVICLKWGTKYGPDYVNRLYKMVKNNLNIPFEFHCMTENSQGIDDEVLIENLADIGLQGWWYKLLIFQKGFLGLSAEDRVLFLDLDIVITGPLDALVEHSERFCIASDINEKRYNSSVMCFTANQYSFIWDSFWVQKSWIVEQMHGDQDWIEYVFKDAVIYPKTLIKSYKIDLNAKTKYSFGRLGKLLRRHFQTFLPKGSVPYPHGVSIVLFHGKPDPKDVMNGPYDKYRQASWISEIYES